MNLKSAAWCAAAVFLATACVFFIFVPLVSRLGGSVFAQQNSPPVATPTPAPTLDLTAAEIGVGVPLWNELQAKQRDFTLAIENLRQAVKQPNNKDAHSLAAFALNMALENSDSASEKWASWLDKTALSHGCAGCQLDLEKRKFVRAMIADGVSMAARPQ